MKSLHHVDGRKHVSGPRYLCVFVVFVLCVCVCVCAESKGKVFQELALVVHVSRSKT